MFSMVEKYVDEGVADLRRRRQRTAMMTIREELAVPTLDAVHLGGDAREQELQRSRSARLVLGLDDQVKVIVLDRVVHDPDAAAYCIRDLGLDRRDEALSSEAGARSGTLHRDVHRVVLVVRGPRDMRQALP